MISYIYTVLINPGIPERKYYIRNFVNKDLGDRKNYSKCSKCNILIHKEMKAVHCDRCQVCTKGNDHHCPWTGKCIAKNNIISFYIFVNSLFIYLVMIFVCIYSNFFYISFKRGWKKRGKK